MFLSAYCGGLWLAALFAMTKISDALQKTKDNEKFQKLLDKGKASFERKLWNGRCYNFDCSDVECRSIMADQLCGQWYLRSSGFAYEVTLLCVKNDVVLLFVRCFRKIVSRLV